MTGFDVTTLRGLPFTIGLVSLGFTIACAGLFSPEVTDSAVTCEPSVAYLVTVTVTATTVGAVDSVELIVLDGLSELTRGDFIEDGENAWLSKVSLEGVGCDAAGDLTFNIVVTSTAGDTFEFTAE